MQNPVSPPRTGKLASALASPQERARAVQAVLDKHGRRWIAGASSPRRSSTRWPARTCCACCCRRAWAAGGASRRLLQGQRGDCLGRRQHGLVRQPVERVDGDLGRRHAARGGGGGVRRPPCRPGLGRAPQQEHGDPRRGRLSADRHLELRQRRPPHQLARRAQRRAWKPDGTPHIRTAGPTTARSCSCAARPRSSTTGTCSACAAPAATAIRSRTCSSPDAHAPARDAPEERREQRADLAQSARRCSTPGASAASPGLGAAHARELRRAGPRQAQPGLAPRAMARNNAVQREIRPPRSQALAARAFLHEAAARSTTPRRRARSTSTCACACGLPPPGA